MRMLIYGAGGMGLYLSARLAQAGHSVTLKARGETLQRGGGAGGAPLSLVTDEGEEQVGDVEIVGELGQASGRFDVAVIATKAWQVDEAAEEIAPVLTADARVITTQNGVDAPGQAAEHLHPEQVLAGAVVVIAQRTASTTVRLTGSEASMILGSLQHPQAAERDQEILSAFVWAGVLTQWNEDILTALWKKLALVASYGAVGALSGAPVGINRAVPQTKALVRNAMQEALTVGNARGASLQEQDLEDIMSTFTHRFSESTTASMQRDLLEGRPSELREQVGAIVSHARECGVDVPIYETVYASQLPRELMARRQN